MRISDWSSDVCSSDLVVDALVASAPDTDDGAPTSVSISAPVATLDSIEHVMHQPGACGRIMLSEEAVHAKFVAVAQITPTKCYAGSFPCRERPEIHDKFHGSAVQQRSDNTIHIMQNPAYRRSVAPRNPLMEPGPAAGAG